MEYLTGGAGIIILLILFILCVLVTRLLGAWILRINNVINVLYAILEQLKKINK
ncbi:hypothetical protein [uncultured Aquimarina sp.]|uniref:hypothetical protein n=1 Tax=uncultured Aquimarina sp. TaxID=575652 RepID=UPI0026253D9F|nr:hypothetical protein [uncultured Aquimarina sp.]